MSSCLALTGVCHAKKAGLRTSSHTLLVFWLHKEVWKWMGHTQTLMLRRSQKVNIFNTVTQFFFSLLHSNAATGSLSVLIMHLVVRNPFSCSLKSVPENLGTELNIVSLLRFQLQGMCIVYLHSWPTIQVVLCVQKRSCSASSACGSFLGFKEVKSGLLPYDSWTTSDNLLA